MTYLTDRISYYLEVAANRFARVPLVFFVGLFCLHANFWITKVVHHVFLCILHSMLVLHMPQSTINVAKQYSAWTRELSFTKPSDWLFAHYRLWQFRGRVDVVVAHYREDLSWLNPYLSKIDHLYLYCKDKPACQKGLSSNLQGATLVVHHLTNEGRETNTYLTHIINYYHHLGQRTVFTMGSLNGNWMRKLSFLFSLSEPSMPKRRCYEKTFFDKVKAFQFSARSTIATSLGDGYNYFEQGSRVEFAEFRPLSQWMYHYFKRDVFEQGCRYGDGQHGAIFSVTNDDIRQYSPDFYRQLLQANQGSDSMEAGYFMERIWRFMFAVNKQI